MPSQPRAATSSLGFLIGLGLVVAVVCLIPRWDRGYSAGRYLWAEDGSVFINQAQRLGLESLWTPYRGYIHAYPRLVALVGTLFELRAQPYVFLVGWAFAFAVMTATMVARASRLGLGRFQVWVLVALVALQPNDEVFFNITNSQSLLGTALATWTLSSRSRRSSLPECIFLALLSLTGPFSIWIAPLLLLRGLLKGESRQIASYLVLVCAAIQAGLLLSSNRFSQAAGLDRDLGTWLGAFGSMVLFGARRPGTLAAACVFWVAFLCALLRPRGDESTDGVVRRRVAWLTLAAAMLSVLAAFYTAKAHPTGILTPESGGRYTWIPYSLVFFAAAIASVGLTRLWYLTVSTLGLICCAHFQVAVRPDLRFESYVNLARYRSVIIPIGPEWRPRYPGWHIESTDPGNDPSSILEPYSIEDVAVATDGLALERSGSALAVQSATADPALVLTRPIVCPGASDIGIEIKMARNREGLMQLFWDPSGDFNAAHSIRRFYPAGEIQAQFAFPAVADGTYVRFDPLEQPGEARISEILVYCLP
ncbi:MAG TPA: hypothetical protein VJU18_06620 [Vicinamibacteria bacterium]|nr:hypothetical protein [Vicinamibacteria bacterium]